MKPRFVGRCLAFLALLASLPSLFFALGALHINIDYGFAPAMWIVSVLSVAGVVFSLRVAFPWPRQRSERVIQSSGRRAVVANGLLAAVFVPWAMVSLVRSGLREANTGALIVLAADPFVLLAPVLWYLGLGVLRFWKTPTARFE